MEARRSRVGKSPPAQRSADCNGREQLVERRAGFDWTTRCKGVIAKFFCSIDIAVVAVVVVVIFFIVVINFFACVVIVVAILVFGVPGLL